MAKNVWNALSYLIPGLRGWRFALNAFNGKSLVDNDANGMLSDIGQGLSDTFFGTTYNQQALQEDAQQFNAAQAQLSRDWQESMYHRNESPAAMMQQFRDAGLNPALMYGGVSPSPSFGSDMASIGTPSAQHGNISLSDALLGAQISNINADTDYKRSEIPVNEQKVDEIKNNCNLILQNIELLKETRLVRHEEFNKLLNDNNFFVETWANRSDIIGADAAKSRLEAKTFMKQFDKLMEQYDAEINYLKSLRNMTDEQKNNLSAAYDILKDQKRIVQKQADLVEQYGTAKELLSLILSGVNSVSSMISAIGSVIPDVSIIKKVN